MTGAAIYISNLSSWTPVSLFWRILKFRLSPRNAHIRPFNPQLPCKLKSKQTVRAWALSLVVPLFLLATLVPVADVTVRIGPQCFPSLDWHGSGTGVKSIGSYNLEDRDYLIRTVAFEAANEPALPLPMSFSIARRAADGVRTSGTSSRSPGNLSRG
jgi:hypothetical protein